MSEDGKEPIISPRGSLHYKSLVIRPTTRFSGAQMVGGTVKNIKDDGDADDLEEDSTKVLGADNIVKLRLLAHGASAPVWLALHAPSLTVIALKTMDVSDRAKRDQLIRELLQLDSCESPFIVSFYGAFYDSGTTKLALEYMNRGSLQGVLDKYVTLKEPVVACIMRQVLYALAFLHEHRKLHRDIKPGNILINHKSEAKLSDFGIMAELDTADEQCNTFVGTTIYMSPERIKDSSYSYPSDIWSLGLVALVALTGKFPFKKDSYWAILNELTEHPSPTLGANFTADAKSFIDSCLHKDPAMRCTANQLLDHKWIASAPMGLDVLPFWPPQMRMFDPAAPADLDAVIRVKQKRRQKGEKGSRKSRSRIKDKKDKKKDKKLLIIQDPPKGKVSPPSLVLPPRAKHASPTTTPTTTITLSKSSFAPNSERPLSPPPSIAPSSMIPLKLQLDDIEVAPALQASSENNSEGDNDGGNDNDNETNAEGDDGEGDVPELNDESDPTSPAAKGGSAKNRRQITLILDDPEGSLSIESPNASSIQITPYDENDEEEAENESQSRIMSAAAVRLAKRQTMLQKDDLSGAASDTLNKVLNVLIYRFQHPELETDPDLPPEGTMLTTSGSFNFSDGLGPPELPDESPETTDFTDVNAKGPPAAVKSEEAVHTNPTAFSDSLSLRFLSMRGRASFFGGAARASMTAGADNPLGIFPGLPGYREGYRGSFAAPGGAGLTSSGGGGAGLANSGNLTGSGGPIASRGAAGSISSRDPPPSDGLGPAPIKPQSLPRESLQRGSLAVSLHDPPSPDHRPSLSAQALAHRGTLFSMNIRELRIQTSKQLSEEKERVLEMARGQLGPGLAMALGINSPPSSTTSISLGSIPNYSNIPITIDTTRPAISSGASTPTNRSSTPTAKSSTPTAKVSTPTSSSERRSAGTPVGTPTVGAAITAKTGTPTSKGNATPIAGGGVMGMPPPHPIHRDRDRSEGHPPVHPGHPSLPPAHPTAHPAPSPTPPVSVVPPTPPFGPNSVPSSPSFAPMQSPSLRPQTQDSFRLMKARLESVALQLGFPLERVVRDFNDLLQRSTSNELERPSTMLSRGY